MLGAATTVVDKRNNKRSIGIMIFLMEAVVASIFWLEDAPINGEIGKIPPFLENFNKKILFWK